MRKIFYLLRKKEKKDMSLTDRTHRMIKVASTWSNTGEAQGTMPEHRNVIGKQLRMLADAQDARTSVCGNPIAK